jgi:hypothetical protein
LAAVFSVIGVSLKASLNLLKDGQPNWRTIQEAFFSGPMLVSVISAALTAVLFYNVYESTEVGKKLASGSGWRSALIIGGLSGLLNEKVVAALEGLFG